MRYRLPIALWGLLAIAAPGAQADQIAFLKFESGVWQAALMRGDGSNVKVVSRFTADATRLSCSSEIGELFVTLNNGAVGRLDTKTQVFVPIATLPRPVLDAVRAPDGSAIAFSFARAGGIDTNDIYIADADGSNLHRLVGLNALQHEPSWSPDGNWIYFASGDGGVVHDLWRIRRDGSSLEQLTVASRYNFDVAVGPKDAFAFSSNRSGDYELYWARPGEVPKRLTDHVGLDARPSFNRRGTQIVFERIENGVPNIWVLTVSSRRARALTTTVQGARGPVWCQ